MRKARALFAALLAALVAGALAAQDAPAPAPDLPDTRAFLEEVRRNLRGDNSLLEQYTFNETYTQSKLDANGAIKKTKTETYEVYPSAEPGELYRRLVARDGHPLSAEELGEQDRKQEAKAAKRARNRVGEDEEARRERLAREEENRRKDEEAVDEIFRMDEFRIVRREIIDGRPTIVVAFVPRPGFEPVTRGGKVAQKLAGEAWVDEKDRQLVRLEAKLLDSLGVGPMRLARLQKGSTAFIQRRKVNGEIWLPSEAHFRGEARVLLVFGSRVEIHSRYFDYKKFSVGTEEEVHPAGPGLGSSDFSPSPPAAGTGPNGPGLLRESP